MNRKQRTSLSNCNALYTRKCLLQRVMDVRVPRKLCDVFLPLQLIKLGTPDVFINKSSSVIAIKRLVCVVAA